MEASLYLSASDAATQLSVQKETLYAYVSRGLLRSINIEGKRSRQYLKEDVERLLQKKRLRKTPDLEVKQALHWGIPLLSTQISQITEGQLYYRGKPLEDMLQLKSLASVIEVLWNEKADSLAHLKKSTLKKPNHHFPELLSYLPNYMSWREKAQLCLTTWSSHDISSEKLNPQDIKIMCLHILQQLWQSVLPLTRGDTLIPHSTPDYINYFTPLFRNARTQSTRKAKQKIAFAVLVLAAEHELNISSFTARCIASARGNAYASLTGAFAALSGQRHGGQVLRVQQLLHSAERLGAKKAVRQTLQQGIGLPLVGHPLYPNGDPRWTAFLKVLEQQDLRNVAPHLAKKLSLYLQVLSLSEEATGHLPTLDWVLAVAAELLCPEHLNAMDWFALGRITGWLAHIQEQYASPHLIRPRGQKN